MKRGLKHVVRNERCGTATRTQSNGRAAVARKDRTAGRMSLRETENVMCIWNTFFLETITLCISLADETGANPRLTGERRSVPPSESSR